MFVLLTMVILALSLSLIVLLAASILSYKTTKDQEKLSPFECGFYPQFSSRSPFSLHFFLIALIFLIFDIELVLIFPYFVKLTYNSIFPISYLWLFLLILSLGLFWEWNNKMLEWTD